MNIRELAAALNLAPSTVSKCLSDMPDIYNIPHSTVKRVRNYASKVGYVPNHFAQKIFHRGDSGIIGVLIRQDNAIQRNLPILHQILARLNAARKEYVVLSNLPHLLQDSLRTFKSMKIYHIIVIGSTNNYGFVDRQILKDLKLYALDFTFGQDSNPVNYYCFRGGIDRKMLYIQLGKLLKQQGFFPFVCDSNCAPRELLKEALITPSDVFKVPENHFDYFFSFGEAFATQLFPNLKKYKAIFLHNDQVAIGLCNALLKRGVRIPEDISVIGFNNSPYSAHVAVPLTSVALPVAQNVELVLDHLLKHTPLPETLLRVPEIVCRESTPDSLNVFLAKLFPISSTNSQIKGD